MEELLFASDSHHLIGKSLAMVPHDVMVMPNFQNHPVKVVTKMRAIQVCNGSTHGDQPGSYGDQLSSHGDQLIGSVGTVTFVPSTG